MLPATGGASLQSGGEQVLVQEPTDNSAEGMRGHGPHDSGGPRAADCIHIEPMPGLSPTWRCWVRISPVHSSNRQAVSNP
jgi:hypothetical protein